jgi:hypothetical protein
VLSCKQGTSQVSTAVHNSTPKGPVLVLGAGAAQAKAKACARILTLGQPGFERTPVRTAGNHVSQLSHCCCALSMALQATVIHTVSALSAAFLPELQNTLQLPKLLSRTVPVD